MKYRILIVVAAVAATLVAGCNGGPREFSTYTLRGDRIWQVDLDDSTTTWVHNSYELEWPTKGVMGSAAERELMEAVFGSYAGGTLRRSCENYLNSQGLLEESEDVRYPCYQVDAMPDSVEMYTEQELKTVCESTERLATVTVTSFIFPEGAAHGSYDIMPLVIDLEDGSIVRLADIVDTNQLGPVVARAVDRLEANREVKECLFDEFVGKQSLPVSQVFSISDAMDTLYLVYGLYWLAPYACGVQEVALPATLLKENMAFTERGRKLFGL